ncbi:uncharacterized protein LOC106181945 isoform X2 [Lingula anatina]|uniref:Uncharacterized protein LOC106181945 isoform X2 n=1 Tax=Lingula anatina TaxID=7574 RepID=A0A1S3KHL7_LINAN|nr:uncharacterized protein LOC106181945 isoform X2 [Lingula anatina]|eukprot:XP_013421969.1 uncharacterized protein LOC106181945 isoform X2 [Lingula anatina]
MAGLGRWAKVAVVWLVLKQWTVIQATEGQWRKPLGVWIMDDVHNYHDVSGGINHASSAGGSISKTTGPRGETNGGTQFIGTSDSYVILGNDGGLDARYSFTWVAWIKNEGSTEAPLFSFHNSGGDNFGLHFFQHPNDHSFTVVFRRRSDGASTNNFYTVANVLTLNTWVLVAVTYDYTLGVMKVYKDGQVVHTEYPGQYEHSTDGQYVAIGSRNSLASDSRHFAGVMSCIHWYDVALTQAQVKQIGANCFTQGLPLPAGWWPLDSDYKGLDVTGNGNNAILSNVSPHTGPFLNNIGSYYLRGSSDSYIEIPNNGKLDVRYSFTYMAYIWPTQMSGNGLNGEGPLFDYYAGTGATWAEHIWVTGQAYPLPAGFWPFSKSYSNEDISSHGIDADLYETSFVTGPHGDPNGAIRVSGTSTSYIEYPQSTVLDARFAFTLMLWYLPGGEPSGPIFQNEHPTTGWGLVIWQHSSKENLYVALRQWSDGAHISDCTFQNIFEEDVWLHLAVTYNYGTGIVTAYKNGIEFGTANVGSVEVATNYEFRTGVKKSDSRVIDASLFCLKWYTTDLDINQINKAKDQCSPDMLQLFNKDGIQPKPVGLWMLGGKDGLKDKGRGGNDGVRSQTHIQQDGPRGEPYGSFYFNDSPSDRIRIPNNGWLDVRRSLTVGVYIYPMSVSSTAYIVEWDMPGGTTTYGPHIALMSGGRVYCKFNTYYQSNGATGGPYATSPNGAVQEQKWQHLAVVYDYDSGEASVWVDGEVKHSFYAGQLQLGTHDNLYIGHGYASTGSDFFGRMACFQIYDVALSQTQIIASKNLCVPEGGLPRPIGLWPLNSRYQGLDVSGGESHASLGNVTFSPGHMGQMGGATSFSGTADSYIEIANSGALDARFSFTYLAYVYLSNTTIGPIFNFGSNASTQGNYGLHAWVTGGYSFFVRVNERSGYWGVSMGSTMPLNSWQFVGATYDYASGMLRTWFNGIEQDNLYVGRLEVATEDYVRMGSRRASYGDNRYFLGTLECVQLYNLPLSQSQIKKAMELCKGAGHHFSSPSNVPTGYGTAVSQVTWSTTARVLSECIAKCTTAETCLSVNYQDVFGQPSQCELSAAISKFNSSVQFEDKGGTYKYFEMDHSVNHICV